jgi:hypothetical protein
MILNRTGVLLCNLTIFFVQWRTKEFFQEGSGVSTNLVEDRGLREWGSGGGSPLFGGFTQFAKEWNLYSD